VITIRREHACREIDADDAAARPAVDLASHQAGPGGDVEVTCAVTRRETIDEMLSPAAFETEREERAGALVGRTERIEEATREVVRRAASLPD
jgi:hypothetical protein